MDEPAGWRQRVARYWELMSEEEAEEFRASSLIALDEATRRRPLTTQELARLAALAEYLSVRLSRREADESLSLREAILYGLLAGYQLCAGAAGTQMEA